MESQPASLAFPWPQPKQLRGPAVRTVIRDPVWMAGLRRSIDAWRTAQRCTLPMARFADLDELGTAASDPRLLDVVEVSQHELSTAADWIHRRRGKNSVVAVVCRQTLVTAENRRAAAQLLCEAGAIEVFATPQMVQQLAEVLSWLQDRSPVSEDPLRELPLPSWAPPWQRPR